jgi:hypothetical protein
MFKRFNRFIKDKGLVTEVLNIIMGILMVVALLVFSFTGTTFSICLVIVLGALMNILNGFTFYRNKEKKTMGMSMIFFGIVIVFILIIFLSMGII